MELEELITEKKEITQELIDNVLNDFKNGLERYIIQDKGFGTIEAKYNLNTEECKLLFEHEAIKGRKVVNPLTGNKRTSKKKSSIIETPSITNSNQESPNKLPELVENFEEIDELEFISKMKQFHENEMKNSVYMDATKLALDIAFKMEKNIILFGPGGHNKSCYSIDYLGAKGIRPYVITMGQGMNSDRLFGGIDLKTLNETGKIEYLLLNSFMNYEYVIFEELFDASDFILEQLKDILSSGIFRNGTQNFKIKTRFIICATNKTRKEFGKNNSLKALLERFPYECEVKWKDYNEVTYTKLLSTKIGFSDPFLTYLLQEFAKSGKIISPRIALLAAETLNEFGMDSLNVIADFNENPTLLKETIAKFKDLAKIKIEMEVVTNLLKELKIELNTNSSLAELETFKTKNDSLKVSIDKLSKFKVPDDFITVVQNVIKEGTALHSKNVNDMILITQFINAKQTVE